MKLSPISKHLCRIPTDNRSLRNVFRDHRTSSNDRTFPNRYAMHNYRAMTNPYIISNPYRLKTRATR
jgi:hypothetical protein